MTTDDIEIVSRIAKGDKQAYQILIARYQDRVFSLLHSIVGCREDAEELCQDVFVKLFFSLDKFQGRSSFSTWLYRIAYNTAISYTRKRKREIPSDTMPQQADDSTKEDPPEELTRQRLQALNRARQTLSTEEQMLISLFYEYNKSVAELVIITGESQSNIKTKLHRIRTKLKKTIDQIQQDESN